MSLEGVDYATAVQVLRDSGQTVNLVVKRRVVLPPTVPSSAPLPTSSAMSHNQLPLAASEKDKNQDETMKVSLARSKKKEDFGVVLGCKIYIKEIAGRSVADKDGILEEGDFVLKLNNTSLEGLTLKEARKLIETSKDKLDLTIQKPSQLSKQGHSKHGRNRSLGPQNGTNDEYGLSKHNYAAQNLYVQPPVQGQNPEDEKNNLARANAAAAAANNGIYATRGESNVPPGQDVVNGNGSPTDVNGEAPARPPLPSGTQPEGKFLDLLSCMKHMILSLVNLVFKLYCYFKKVH